MNRYGAIEAGGTKFVCGVGSGPDDLVTMQIPTTTPQETIGKAIDFLREQGSQSLKAVGIGSFGPIDLHPHSATFGFITSTPKPGWQDCDLVGPVAKALAVPVAFDTDVNAAALGEGKWGAAQELTDFIYLTVGTGIGGGAVVAGNLLHGMIHPEMGHVRLPRNVERDPYTGCCPFHGDCLEGLACGPAMEARWGVAGGNLPADHPAWVLEAHYLALGLATWVCTMSPQRIVMGGGVMKQSILFPLIRKELVNLLNGYIRTDEITTGIEQYVVPPGLADRAGILGALVLAEQAKLGAAAPLVVPAATPGAG
jgi:fructokinase